MKGFGRFHFRPHHTMATRLLSFLSDIEQALIKESASNMGPSWDSLRMVNYKAGLARLTLTPPPGAEAAAPGGTIFLQSFLLADGSLCLKAGLSWEGTATTTTLAVYAKPGLDGPAESKAIASVWLAGPPATASLTTMTVPELGTLAAAAG